MILDPSSGAFQQQAVVLEVWLENPADGKRLYRVKLDDGTEKRIHGNNLQFVSLGEGVGSTPVLLCVEDDSDISGYVCEMLKIAGYQTMVAANVIEALRLARTQHFDLILLDYHLPDGTGLELCRMIRAIDPKTPILFYSNITDPETRRSAIAAGAQGYIRKMEAFDILEQTITKLLESGALMASAGSSPGGAVPSGPNEMFSQQDFDHFVERYNADYYFILTRAGSGQYDCLLTSFFVLKDLYTAIGKLHEVGRFQLRRIPYPITFRASEPFLSSLGFGPEEIERIGGFLSFVKETQGKEFEQLIGEGAPTTSSSCGSPPCATILAYTRMTISRTRA
jgi:CheY-like chemotaxis protein